MIHSMRAPDYQGYVDRIKRRIGTWGGMTGTAWPTAPLGPKCADYSVVRRKFNGSKEMVKTAPF